jgi:hypothetical protein
MPRSMNNLTMVLDSLGKDEEAEIMIQQALNRMDITQSAEHS